MAIEIGRYKTKPFDCWHKCKELRDKYFSEMWEAPAEGRVLASGATGSGSDLLAGFAPFDFIGGEAFAGQISGRYQEFLMECFHTLEAKGFGTDSCAYLRIHWGTILLDKTPWGRAPRPHFYLTNHSCYHGTWYQFAAEHYGVPLIVIETPHSFTVEQMEINREYITSQYLDAIEKIEKILGRKCDDEKLIEGVYTVTENRVLWARICEYQRFIPLPFDAKNLVSLMVPNLMGDYRKETTDYLKELLAEVQDRVANEIGTLETERARIWYVNPPPWFAIGMLKYPNLYGAVLVGPNFYHQINGTWVWNDDHTERIPGKTVQEQGVELKTREDAVRFIARRTFPQPGCSFGAPLAYSPMEPYNRDYETLKQMEKYQCGSAIIHINRGCKNTTAAGVLSTKRYLGEHNIPAMTYEGSLADPRDLNESQVIDSMDSFMESMGLTKLSL